MNINIVSRGKGKSAVAAAAYRAGESLKNEYDGITHDYTSKRGIVYSEIQLPEHAPADFCDRHTLWNAVEKAERAKNAQLCREVRVALPKEFDNDQNAYLVHEYVRQNFTSQGMCADIAIHNKGDGNPHAHILLTMRPLEKDGSFGAKSRMEYILDNNGKKIKLPSGRYKTRKVTATNWDSRENAETWRKAWADILNKHLKHFNITQEQDIDHRSYKRQGVEQIPTIHLGVSAHQMEQKGIATERGNINREIQRANAQFKNIDAQIQTTQEEKANAVSTTSPVKVATKPPRPKFIIDLENSIKAKDSPAYENWAKIFNLQQMAQTLLYIQTNGYDSLQMLQSVYRSTADSHNRMLKELKTTEDKIKDLQTLKRQSKTYRKTAEVYKKYTAPRQLSYFKNQYYEKHKKDIEAHKVAKSYIYDELKLSKFPSLKTLSGEISALTETKMRLQEAIPTEREKFNTLDATLHNVRMLLGYRELELQNRLPATTINNRLDVPVYKATFSEPKNSKDRELYFQNQYLNHECANTLINTLQNNLKAPADEQHHNGVIANACMRIYGIERTEWVLDSPLVNTSDINLRSAIDHVKELVKNKIAEDYWRNAQTSKQSFEDSIVAAKRKADAYNQSRVTATPTKPKKKTYGMEI